VKALTSRQRVAAALERRAPDRVPIDFGGPFTTISAAGPYGYEALCRQLGYEDHPPVVVLQVANVVINVDERLMERFHSDTRWIYPGWYAPERLPDGTMRDIYGILLKPEGVFNMPNDDLTPLHDAQSVAELDAYPYWPDAKDPIVVAGKREEARQLSRETDKCVVASLGMGPGHLYSFLRGFDNWLLDMQLNPEFYSAFTERLTRHIIDYNLAFLGEAGEYIDVVFFADDVGMQTQPLLSLKDYRKFVKPYHAELIKAFRSKAPRAKVVFHSCGSVWDFIPDFLEIGVDVLNPIQTRAWKMDPAQLKKEFGDRLSFHGGLDMQELMPFGTPEQVTRGVKELIETLGPGGGYVFTTAQEITPEVKPENIIAAFDAAWEYGAKPQPR
jgi:uroporphyrinogen decarboxylase